ncbi:MAG TPA: hypothetical protein VFE24_12270 [Pirellulales bacterium]|nr:hypothetical protein [Pirellulales bacterium]
MRHTRSWTAGLLAQLCLVASVPGLTAADKPKAATARPVATSAPEPKAEDKAADPAAISIPDALNQKVAVEFIETPLADVLAFLSERTKVPFAFDQRGLNEAGIAADQPININIKNVTLKSALDLILGQIKNDPTYALHDEVLLITSRERASNWMTTKVYPLGDLAKTDMDIPALLMAHVEPQSWDAAGGHGSVHAVAGMLVVTQTYENFSEVENLLMQMHKTLEGTRAGMGR